MKMDKEEKWFVICFIFFAIYGFLFVSATLPVAVGSGMGGAIVTWFMYKIFIKIRGLFKKIVVR